MLHYQIFEKDKLNKFKLKLKFFLFTSNFVDLNKQ